MDSVKNNFNSVVFLNEKNRSGPAHKHFRLYGEKEYIPEDRYNNSIIVNTLDDLENCFRKNMVPDRYIVISKDPYSWFISYIEWARMCKWRKPSHHYINEWNCFYKKWHDLSLLDPTRILFVRYIDLLRNFNKQLNAIARYCGISEKKRYLKPAKTKCSPKFNKQRKLYYLNEDYLRKFSCADLKKLNTILDKELVVSLGYDLKDTGNISR